MTAECTESNDEPALVTTPEACVKYVNRVGICSWRDMDRLPHFPSLEQVTPWEGGQMMMHTWSWKDDLPIGRQLYYGKLLEAETPTFVSLELLPVLIAAQGDNDAWTLHEKGRLAQMAFELYQHIERSGPTPSSQLPWRSGSRQSHLVALERRFLITKHGLTGHTRGTYGYIWGKCEEHFPDVFPIAAQIRVSDARERIVEHLKANGVNLTMKEATKLFRWTDE